MCCFRFQLAILFGVAPHAGIPFWCSALMEAVASWSQSPESLSTHLIVSLPSRKRPRQLNLRLRYLKSDWQAFDSQSFPAVNLYPSSFYSLADQPPRQPWKLEVLAVALDYRPELLPSKNPDYSGGLSYTWRACWIDAFLGKRDSPESPISDNRLSHRLSVSRLGVERVLPNSDQLDEYLNNRLARLPNVRRTLRQWDFEVRFDDSTSNFEVWIWLGDASHQIKTYVRIGDCSQLLPPIDPFQIIPQLVQSMLRPNRPYHRNNLIQQYLQVVTFFQKWITIHQDCSTTTCLPDLGNRLRPVETVVRWSEAFFRFFFCPLVKVSRCTALFGALLREIIGVPCGLTQVQTFILVDNTLKYFDEMQKLTTQLDLAKQSGQISALFKACVEVHNTYQVSLLKYVPGIFYLTLNILESEYHFQAWKEIVQKEIRASCKLSAVKRLSRRTVSSLKLTEGEVQVLKSLIYGLACDMESKGAHNDFVANINFGWLAIQNIAGVPRLRNTDYPGTFQRSSKINMVTSYCRVLIFFKEAVKLPKKLEICLIQENNVIKTYDYPENWIQLDSCVSSYFTDPPIWSNGTLFKLGRRLRNQLYVFVIDFRQCAAKQAKPPTFLCKYLNGFELDPKELLLKRGNIWAYASGNICLISYNALSLPTLWISRVTHDQIHEPTELDWCSSLPQSKIQKLAKFGSRLNIKSHFHLAVTEKPARLYMCILDAKSDSAFEQEMNFELTILVSNLNSGFLNPQIFTHKIFHLTEYVNRRIAPHKQISSSVIRAIDYEFLMLNFGEPKYMLIGLIGYRLQWLPVNMQQMFSIPKGVGTQMNFYGVQSNYLMLHLYSTERIRFKQNLKLSFEYLEFSY